MRLDTWLGYFVGVSIVGYFFPEVMQNFVVAYMLFAGEITAWERVVFHAHGE